MDRNERLIENVRKYPCLWKSDTPEYKNYQLKETSWREVIKACDLPDVKEGRNLWKILRDGHRQALTRTKASTGQAGSTRNKWKYELQMEFLVPTMTMRSQQTNTRSLDKDDNQKSHDDISIEEEIIIENDIKSEDIKIEYVQNGEEQIEDCDKPIQEQKRREKRSADNDVMRKQIIESSSSNTSCENSALEKFFSSMFYTTSGLPDELQLRVQRQVFNAVMEAKEEHLMGQAIYTSPGPSQYLPSNHHQSDQFIQY
ncbi:uncharacterized protein ACR2FA_012794 [Aphomia sociella]